MAGRGGISFSFQDIQTKSENHFSVKSAFVVDSNCGLFTKFFYIFFILNFKQRWLQMTSQLTVVRQNLKYVTEFL